jgi:parvulin-like peptidyl-prolyl isomerase
LPTLPRFLSLLALAGLCVAAGAQAPTPPTPAIQTAQPAGPAAGDAALPPPPPATAVAAKVNGKPIAEVAVYRALRQVPPAKWAEARTEIINFLVENALIDQYLEALKIPADAKETEIRWKQVIDEINKSGKGVDYKEVLKKLLLTEDELKAQIVNQLRWDKFVDQQSPEKILREMFDKNKDMFDGSMVHARHVLLAGKAGDAKAAEEAKSKLTGFKKQVQDAGQQALAKLAAGSDKLAQEKARTKAMDDAFAALATKESTCPSKSQGGDIGWFPRAGRMVEPFARAAFALQPYQMSDVVATEFGFHLILVTERKAGKEFKFEDVKETVKEVYSDRLREAVLARMRPRAQIVVNSLAKQDKQ